MRANGCFIKLIVRVAFVENLQIASSFEMFKENLKISFD